MSKYEVYKIGEKVPDGIFDFEPDIEEIKFNTSCLVEYNKENICIYPVNYHKVDVPLIYIKNYAKNIEVTLKVTGIKKVFIYRHPKNYQEKKIN